MVKEFDFIVRVIMPIIMVGIGVYHINTYDPSSDQIKVANNLIERGSCQLLEKFIESEGIADKIPNAVENCYVHAEELKNNK